MENQTTVKEVLRDVNKLLNEINIPISMVESIGIPVARAINGIQLCLNAFEEQDKARQEDHEPEIEIVETGSADTIPEDGERI